MKIWKVLGIVAIIIFLSVCFIALFFILLNSEKKHQEYTKCSELYGLDSCELYSCRANNSNWIPDIQFNQRNYEICKIILNNKLSFNESLNLLNTITYDS